MCSGVSNLSRYNRNFVRGWILNILIEESSLVSIEGFLDSQWKPVGRKKSREGF